MLIYHVTVCDCHAELKGYYYYYYYYHYYYFSKCTITFTIMNSPTKLELDRDRMSDDNLIVFINVIKLSTFRLHIFQRCH